MRLGRHRSLISAAPVRTVVCVLTVLATSGCVPVLLPNFGGAAPGPNISLVNVPETGHGMLGVGVTDPPAISNDGKVITFETSDYLTRDDHEGTWDIYARDTSRRETTLISVTADGVQDPCGSNLPLISGDGRYVSYWGCTQLESVAAPPGTVGLATYIKDRLTGTLWRAGIPASLGYYPAGSESLDRDGSHASVLCIPLQTGIFGVCEQDPHTGETTLASIRTDGLRVTAYATPASISDGGRLVGFVAPYGDVVPSSTDMRRQLFVRDLVAGITRPVAIDAAQYGGDLDGRISADGTAAVVWQIAPPYHILRVDLRSGVVQRVDQTGCTNVAASPTYPAASISGDGNTIAFQSGSDALVQGDTNHHDDVFVWRASSPCSVERVSLGHGFQQGNGDSYWPAISGDGSSIAFVSDATNLLQKTTDPTRNLFVVRMRPPH